MGTYWDDEGLHWQPLRWFPWVERAKGYRKTMRYDLEWGCWYRWAPKIIEECERADGVIMQTIQFEDGREQIREAVWRS